MITITSNKYIVRLPKESRASSFIDIQPIIQAHPIRTEGNHIFIDFPERTDDLKHLIENGRSLSAFKLFIDGEPIPKNKMLYISRWALFCPYATHCKGICRVDLRSYGFKSVLDIIQTVDPKNSLTSDSGDLQRLIDSNYSWIHYIEKEESDEIEINHDILVSEIRKDLQIQEKYCPIFNWKKIAEKILNLPSPIEVSPKIGNWELLFYYLEDILPRTIETKMESILRQLFIEAGFIKLNDDKSGSEEEE